MLIAKKRLDTRVQAPRQPLQPEAIGAVMEPMARSRCVTTRKKVRHPWLGIIVLAAARTAMCLSRPF